LGVYLREFLYSTKKLLKELLSFPEATKAYGFNEIIDINSIREINESYEEKISAIDGGTSEIIRLPTFSIVLNRIYCNCFIGMKKLDYFDRCTFISLTRMINDNGKIFYETKILHFIEGELNIKFPIVDSYSEEIRIGKNRGDISRVISMARRFGEWEFVRNALKSGAKIILMDGSLQTSFPNESEFVKQIYNEVEKNNSIIAGLSKTSTIFTENGLPISGFLEYLGRKKGLLKWAVKIGKSEEWTNKALIYFVKLHENSDRCYRLDVYEKVSEEDIEKLLSSLVSNSKYFAYPGYPYALIDAHNLARVGRDEAIYIRNLIFDLLDIEDIKRIENSEQIAHKILDELG